MDRFEKSPPAGVVFPVGFGGAGFDPQPLCPFPVPLEPLQKLAVIDHEVAWGNPPPPDFAWDTPKRKRERSQSGCVGVAG